MRGAFITAAAAANRGPGPSGVLRRRHWIQPEGLARPPWLAVRPL